MFFAEISGELTQEIHHFNILSACNIIINADEGVYTLRNYGKQINCSVSIMSPQFIEVLTLNIGVTRKASSTAHIVEAGYFEEVSIITLHVTT